MQPQPQFKPTTELPYRFRESSFRFYESIIAAVVSGYPFTITIKAKLDYDLSPVTFACRFRDALRSYYQHNWKPTIIDRTVFERIYPSIAVSEQSSMGLLRIGDRETLRTPAIALLHNSLGSTSHNAVVHEPIAIVTADEATLLCTLAEKRLLACEVKCTGFTPIMIQYYEQKYDISIEHDATTGISSII